MILLRELLFLLSCWFLVDLSNSLDLRHGHSDETNLIGEVCQRQHIVYSAKGLHQLKNCSIIEGYLIIGQFELTVDEWSYEGLEFPLLTEVTEFVLTYNVDRLKSLGKLFPNLRVIRGNKLIHNFSFMVINMRYLQEIGLKSLIEISRGNVRIEKNPLLCFADTIDWAQITSSSKDNVIKNNRETNDCPTCPGVDDNLHSLVYPQLNGKYLCWNRSQQICPSKCGNSTCNAKGECCDDSCLGCDDVGKCLSCRHLTLGNSTNLQCVKNCPTNMFSHKNRRCVTESECRAIKHIFREVEQYPYMPHGTECSIKCANNFYLDETSGHRKCIPCVGTCKKECPPGYIYTIEAAQQYRGCTHINGQLVINIRKHGGHAVVRELEISLSNIETIEGNLVIERAYPLLSLGFFKKLRLVKNYPVGKEKYGIKVIGNENLQALFAHNVTIEHGRMFFHFNPNLCMNVIEEFKFNVVDLRNESAFTVDEVAPDTNGDKTTCDITELLVELKRIDYDVVIMQLAPICYDDERQMLGYLIYYKPAPYQNVTMFDVRDACGVDGWQMIDVHDNNRNSTPITIIVTQLKADNQYAYYIQTYTLVSERHVSLTEIKYFRTSATPELTSNLSAAATASSEINVQSFPEVNFHCPSNFDPDGPSGNGCIQCVGICKKECPPANIVRELEDSLSNIEVIEGNLIIKRSYAILSLGFFKKLRLVKNYPVGKETYGIKVIGNENLQALFAHNVTIEHGRMFFHFNPKLCINVIEQFKFDVVDLRNETTFPDDEVAPDTNGDKTACRIAELHVEVKRIDYGIVVMQVKPFLYEDGRVLLGYLMYYRPAPYQNVTMFDSRDACGGDAWHVEEISHDNSRSTPVVFIVTQLKSDTQYAYYIRTNTVNSEQSGASTLIKYFRTAPNRRLSVSANGSSGIEQNLAVSKGQITNSRQNRIRYYFTVEDTEDWIEFENALQNTMYIAK